ncbi:MAG TPA: efflux RND transporter permease subunit, partial [Chloroflexota bacterium]
MIFTERAAKTIAQDVERRVNSVRAELPDESKPPIVEKFDPNAQPIMQLSLGAARNADSESEQTLAGLQRLAEDDLKKDLEVISGVARITVIGGLEREIQVQVEQQKLQSHGVSILQVTQALAADNLNVPAGSITQRNQDWTIRLTSQAQTLADLQSILVANNPGGSVRVRDVAVVLDTYKKVSAIQRTDGVASVGVLVYKQASANTVATAEAVSKQLVHSRTRLPPGVSITVPQDSSIFVKSSVADVQVQLGLAVLLTGLVLLVFLHTFRSTAIVLLAIPTSLVATFGVMSILGLTFNFMSLMGLALTVGILVDDSIVVLENIGRHLHLGEPPREAAMNGRSEIGMAAIAITLVDVVVFTPIAFMTGPVGQYFREFGLVIASATLFSLAVSFTLTPLLASRWYRPGQGGGASHKAGSRHPLAAFARTWDAGFARLQVGYGRALQTSLRYRWGVVLVAIASFIGGLALVLFGVLSTEFLPQDDAGVVLIGLEMPAGTTLGTTSAATSKVEDRLLAVPETESVFTSVGVGSDFSAAGQSRFATIYVRLVDKQHRQRGARAVAEQIRDFGSEVPGLTLKSSPLSTFGGGGGGAVQVHIQGEDQQVLATLASRVAEIVRNVQGTVDISDGGVVGQPELVVSIDRERAADVGLSAGQVASVLRTGLAGSIVGTFRPAGTKGWDVNVILNLQDRASVDQVVDIPVITPHGSTIRVGQVAQVSRLSGPTQVSRRNRDRSVTVTADVNGRASGDVSRDIQNGLDRLVIPPGYKVAQGGDAENQNEAFLQ